MLRQIALFFAVVLGVQAQAQELNATVRVTAPRLQTVDPQVFKTMERDILDFFNNTRWTLEDYEQDEHIECAFQINIIDEISTNIFTADIAFQALRPVYGTDYKTPLISHVDKDVIITYEEYQPIQESRDIYNDNLSSALTFYAYVIIGYDYDSFSSLGGDPYFTVAQGVITNIPPNVLDTDKGWSSLQNRNNRYWLVENMRSPKMLEYRRAMYAYHRGGLDYMSSELGQGLNTVLEALKQVDSAREKYPQSTALRVFANTKSDEVIEIFKGADRAAKSTVQQIMRKLDVSNASKYNVLGQ